jgi:hypothetical protein
MKGCALLRLLRLQLLLLGSLRGTARTTHARAARAARRGVAHAALVHSLAAGAADASASCSGSDPAQSKTHTETVSDARKCFRHQHTKAHVHAGERKAEAQAAWVGHSLLAHGLLGLQLRLLESAAHRGTARAADTSAAAAAGRLHGGKTARHS